MRLLVLLLVSGMVWANDVTVGLTGQEAQSQSYNYQEPVNTVPEPSTWLLLAVGVAVLRVSRAGKRGR